MKIPLAWLRTYVDLPDDPIEIAEKLATLGFPVENIDRPPYIRGVVVGRIHNLIPHPQADRLQICHIDIGEKETLTIATAATNVADDFVMRDGRLSTMTSGSPMSFTNKR